MVVEIFEDLKDKRGNFNGHFNEDIVGILNLYEASYYSVEGESLLDDARDYATRYLKENLKNMVDQNMSSLISHALTFPLHWRVPRVEAKWFIEAYEKRSGTNSTLIELAKLDFNTVQAIHQEDLKYASRSMHIFFYLLDKKKKTKKSQTITRFMAYIHKSLRESQKVKFCQREASSLSKFSVSN